MTDNELRHLNRANLIEIIYELQKNEQKIRAELEAMKQQLESRELKISEAGSIAEAVVGLNDVFVNAQAAADQYLEQIRTMNQDTETRCGEMLADAKLRSETMLEQAEAEVQEKREQADREIAEKWDAFQAKTEQILKAHSELSDLLKRSRS